MLSTILFLCTSCLFLRSHAIRQLNFSPKIWTFHFLIHLLTKVWSNFADWSIVGSSMCGSDLGSSFSFKKRSFVLATKRLLLCLRHFRLFLTKFRRTGGFWPKVVFAISNDVTVIVVETVVNGIAIVNAVGSLVKGNSNLAAFAKEHEFLSGFTRSFRKVVCFEMSSELKPLFVFIERYTSQRDCLRDHCWNISLISDQIGAWR